MTVVAVDFDSVAVRMALLAVGQVYLVQLLDAVVLDAPVLDAVDCARNEWDVVHEWD